MSHKTIDKEKIVPKIKKVVVDNNACIKLSSEKLFLLAFISLYLFRHPDFSFSN